MFDRSVIYTYADGTPIEGRPGALPPDHVPFDERRRLGMDYADARPHVDRELAHERAWHEYEDRVAAVGLRTFTTQFRESLQG